VASEQYTERGIQTTEVRIGSTDGCHISAGALPIIAIFIAIIYAMHFTFIVGDIILHA